MVPYMQCALLSRRYCIPTRVSNALGPRKHLQTYLQEQIQAGGHDCWLAAGRHGQELQSAAQVLAGLGARWSLGSAFDDAPQRAEDGRL